MCPSVGMSVTVVDESVCWGGVSPGVVFVMGDVVCLWTEIPGYMLAPCSDDGVSSSVSLADCSERILVICEPPDCEGPCACGKASSSCG